MCARVALAAMVLFVASDLPALADDSTAMLGVGGLVLTHNSDIRMATEDLFLSPNSVKVHYTFTNDSDHDINAVVAFPLPDIDNTQFWESPLGSTVPTYPNFVGFKVLVNAKPVPTTVEEHAFLNGKEVTAQVRAMGLPLNYAGSDLGDRLDKLPNGARARLVKEGLAEDEGPQQLYPKWTATTKFWWRQLFPAHATINVDHSYQPITGTSFFTGLIDAQKLAAYRSEKCIDKATTAAILAKGALEAKAPNGGSMLNQYDTQFVIKTANNWKGPIGRFHLTIDKLKPDNIVSMCWPGTFKKISPTRFESILTNFAPQSDINLMVLEAPAPN